MLYTYNQSQMTFKLSKPQTVESFDYSYKCTTLNPLITLSSDM